MNTIKNINYLHCFIHRDIRDKIEEIKNNKEISNERKEWVISLFELEIPYIEKYMSKLSPSDIVKAEENNINIIEKIIDYSFDNYNLLNSNKDIDLFDYYHDLMNWYKISMVNTYNIYKALLLKENGKDN